eukprot:11196470-Lingulodinium_polyedra.AAC.1
MLGVVLPHAYMDDVAAGPAGSAGIPAALQELRRFQGVSGFECKGRSCAAILVFIWPPLSPILRGPVRKRR